MMSRAGTASGVAIVAALACSPAEPARPLGSFEVEWTGADTGKLAAPGVAEWCDSLRVLELRAIHGDTGLALAVYPTESIAPAGYPVVPPERADSNRPSAGVALRWFAETSIRGFRGDSGQVRLEPAAPGLARGRFTAHLRASTGGGPLQVTGSFKDLAIGPARGGCTRAQRDDEVQSDEEPLDDQLDEEPDSIPMD